MKLKVQMRKLLKKNGRMLVKEVVCQGYKACLLFGLQRSSEWGKRGIVNGARGE